MRYGCSRYYSEQYQEAWIRMYYYKKVRDIIVLMLVIMLPFVEEMNVKKLYL